MKRRFSVVGAVLGFLWGLLVVLLSDSTHSSAWGDFAIRAAVVCVFAGIGAGVGLLGSWVWKQLRARF